MMKINKTALEGVLLLEPCRYHDERGYFMEVLRLSDLSAAAGHPINFVQENESKSKYGVLRGLHYQLPPHAQAKLVRVVSGRVWDVAVDIRRHSPTFGAHFGVELSAENSCQLYIPEGFAHGFVALSDEAVLQYKCTDYYHPECEGGIAWDDPQLAIPWPIAPEAILLSEKDRRHGVLNNSQCFE